MHYLTSVAVQQSESGCSESIESVVRRILQRTTSQPLLAGSSSQPLDQMEALDLTNTTLHTLRTHYIAPQINAQQLIAHRWVDSLHHRHKSYILWKCGLTLTRIELNTGEPPLFHCNYYYLQKCSDYSAIYPCPIWCCNSQQMWQSLVFYLVIFTKRWSLIYKLLSIFFSCVCIVFWENY